MGNKHEKMFTVKCSRKELEHLQELFESGELNEMLGVEVVDMGITTTEIPTQSIVLHQWLRGIIEQNWKVVNIIENTTNINFAFPFQDVLKKELSYSSISCQRTYKLRNYIDNKDIELIVKIELAQSQGEIEVNLKAQPSKNQPFLPTGLKLILCIGSNVLAEVEAKNTDYFIKQELTGDIGDNFSFKLELGDFSVIENFVI